MSNQHPRHCLTPHAGPRPTPHPRRQAGLAYRAQSWDLDLQVELGPPGGTPGEAPGSGASTVAYLGGHQIQWMKQFVGVLNRMPPQVGWLARRAWWAGWRFCYCHMGVRPPGVRMERCAPGPAPAPARQTRTCPLPPPPPMSAAAPGGAARLLLLAQAAAAAGRAAQKGDGQNDAAGAWGWAGLGGVLA